MAKTSFLGEPNPASTCGSDCSKSHLGIVQMKKPPVFIVGSPRSGTTLLYHMLLSAGGFAVYRTESKVFDLVFPQVGSLRKFKNRRRALDIWLKSKLFSLSGVERSVIEPRILNECRSGGDFLRIVMEAIAEKQNLERWADNTPENLLYLPAIRREIPDARVIHLIRDGRDVALSLAKTSWIRHFPWDAPRQLLVAGLYWEWMVTKGAECGGRIFRDYLEVHYEDLVTDPYETLKEIGRFIDHQLDYDQIRGVAIGSIAKPNTSFSDESEAGSFQPVGRWKTHLPSEDLVPLEELVGGTLEILGYARSVPAAQPGRHSKWSGMRSAYRGYWDSKLWLKTNTPLPRFFGHADPSEL